MLQYENNNNIKNQISVKRWLYLAISKGKDVQERYMVMVELNLSERVSSVAQSFLNFCNPMDYTMPGFPVHYQLLELAETHAHRVGDAI